jgi:SNF2 family DNA or RNA helicase
LGEPFNAAQLKEELRPYLLRRAKADVLPELPKETYITLDVELDTTQRRLYEQMRKKRFVEWGGKTIDSPSAMVALNRLRQIAVGPETLVEDYGQILTGCKADAIMEILEGLDDQKFIIFSQYARAIRCLYPLVKRSMGVAMFTGQDSTNYRTEQERLLREDDNTRGLMSTYQAGGEGSNYTDASIVICLDLWWAPAVNAQAVGRCSRMGQKSPVTIYSINAVNTVESRVLEKINSKLGLFDQLITEQRVLGYALEELGK